MAHIPWVASTGMRAGRSITVGYNRRTTITTGTAALAISTARSPDGTIGSTSTCGRSERAACPASCPWRSPGTTCPRAIPSTATGATATGATATGATATGATATGVTVTGV